MSRTPVPRSLLAVTVAVVALIAAVPGPAVLGQDITPLDEASALLASELNTIEVIERVGPSVVAVTVSVRGETMLPFEDAPRDGVPEDFQRFFGDREPVQQSSGSGFLIGSVGEPYLVTNFHVVEGALEPQTVEFRDGAEIEVTFPADTDELIPVDVVGVNPSEGGTAVRVSEGPRHLEDTVCVSDRLDAQAGWPCETRVGDPLLAGGDEPFEDDRPECRLVYLGQGLPVINECRRPLVLQSPRLAKNSSMSSKAWTSPR